MSKALRPLFVTVTWGAGGSTAARSLELAELCQRQLGLTTCLHLTCTNMSRKILDETLDEAKAIGVCNILALRGDPPRSEYEVEGQERDDNSNETFVWAIDLVRYIRRKYGDFFCIGVAAYPEGHADESHPTTQDPEHDLPYLIEKTKAGADFIMTQLFYDESAYIRLEKRLREHESGLFKQIPIIPGLMPIQSYQILKRTAKLSHASLPEKLLRQLEPIKTNDEAVKEAGVDFLTEMVANIHSMVLSRNARGFHFYTLNLEKAVGWILENSRLIPQLDEEDTAIDDAKESSDTEEISTNNQNLDLSKSVAIPTRNRHSSTASASAQLSTSFKAERTASPTSRAASLAVTHGLTPAGREATWDDYPNGRFGDARSPAFNTPLSYSPYSFDLSPQQARRMWGQPTSIEMITDLFANHLGGEEPSQLPWSDTATLSPETKVISDKLLLLIRERSWWTIASQPAVNGLLSSDPIHGWGPSGGFVFQKPFVEFFLPAVAWREKLRPCLERLRAGAEVSWYAENCHGHFETSEPDDAVHAVTWGSFKGKEIATATMVEQVNFRQWAEEAFGRWEQWSHVVLRPESRDFLQSQKHNLWLVNVIGHGYREGEGNRLWEILMNA